MDEHKEMVDRLVRWPDQGGGINAEELATILLDFTARVDALEEHNETKVSFIQVTPTDPFAFQQKEYTDLPTQPPDRAAIERLAKVEVLRELCQEVDGMDTADLTAIKIKVNIGNHIFRRLTALKEVTDEP